MIVTRARTLIFIALGCCALVSVPTSDALVVSERDDELAELVRADPIYQPTRELAPAELVLDELEPVARETWQQFRAARSARGTWDGLVDRRSGLIEIAEGAGEPWIPGFGNGLTSGGIARHLAGRSEVDLATLESIARSRIHELSPLLGSEGRMLVLDRAASGRIADYFWNVEFQVHTPWGPIEGARIFFRVNNGNLVQWGAERVPPSGVEAPRPVLDRDEALGALFAFLPASASRELFVGKQRMIVLPTQSGHERSVFSPGRGYRLTTAWELVFRLERFGPTWRARIDAATGEVIDFRDVNDYALITGGYWPVSWRVDGVQQGQVTTGWPFATVSPTGGTTNTSGVYFWDSSTQNVRHAGPYVTIDDQCGADSTTTSGAGGNLDFGTYGPAGPGDCTAQDTTNDTALAGNTPSARQQYWHLNKIAEKGRSYLTGNIWLQSQLTANVNISDTCNAYWDGSTVNFFLSGGGCNNTGEDAGVSMHEWGHGMDSNDGSAATADNGTGETYGDITALLQTLDSCVGQGFLGSNCSGYGNACNLCDGVRDIDWGEHADNAPMTVNFIQTTCPCSRASAFDMQCKGTYNGPCGINITQGTDNKEGHCESLVSSGALFDFAAFDLQSGCGTRNGTYEDWDCPLGTGGPYDQAGAFTVLDRLWYLSRPAANQAFTCDTAPATWTSHGCNAGSNWKTLRAVDDDDGDLTNGTPHSCQLAAAFDRHGISCTADTAYNVCFRGCTPPSNPTLAAPTAGNNQISLSWSDVGVGNVYDLYRNEVGCSSGFTKIANDLTGTTFQDNAVGNGTTYYYQVLAHPTGNEACSSSTSTCLSATPSAQASAKYISDSALLTALPTDIDSDGWLDNCETGTAQVTLINDGNAALTNVSFTASSSDAAVSVTTPMPVNVGPLAINATTTGSFDFDLDGATCGGTVEIDIAVTATEMSGSNLDSFSFDQLELDLLALSSPTDDFEADLDGWTLDGFARESGSADSGSFALHSSSGLDGVCETAVSPQFQVTGTSAVTLAVSYDIEAPPWDKANVHAVNVDTGTHTLLSPTGATYVTDTWNTGLCHVSAENGWAGTALTWNDAVFNLSGLTPGDTYYLEVNYNTDAALSQTGFWFDNVRWADVNFIGCDAQGDGCTPCVPPAVPTGLTASAGVADQVDLSWNGLAMPPSNYRIYRSEVPGGPYVQVGSVGGGTTTFTDAAVVPGTTYYYVVRAFDTCESGNSNEDNATPFGDCTSLPTFAGVASASILDAGGSCGLRVNWSAGTNSCGGEPLVYNLYRSTSSGFTPGPGNLVASCLSGTSFDDTSVSSGVTYYYKAFAEDAEPSGNGPCRSGNVDGNSAQASGGLSAGPGTLLSENFDALAVNALPAGWQLGTFNGGSNSWLGVRACNPASAPNALRYGGTPNCTSKYSANEQALVATDAMSVPVGVTGVTATFNHNWAFGNGDEGRLYVSNSFPTFTLVGPAFLSGAGYTTTTGFAGTQAATSTTVDLGAFCDAQIGWGVQCANETLYFAWVGWSDTGQTGAGWNIDDVLIAYSAPTCTAAPQRVDFLTATATNGQNVVEWQNPSTGTYGSTMIRWSTADYPADPTVGTLLVDQNDGQGLKGSATHSTLANGTTYYYSAFVDNGSAEYSAREQVAARPFDTSGSVKWAYSSGATALTPPGIGSVFGVANDRVLHSMDSAGGGVWPAGWTPLAMSGSAQDRPPVVPLPLAGATKVVFLGSQDGRVYAANGNTGAQLWSSPVLATNIQASPAGYFTGFGGATDLLMVGTRAAGVDNEMIGLDPADGSVVWTFDNSAVTDGIGIISGVAAVDYPSQRVFFASRTRTDSSSPTVWSLNLLTGTLDWATAAGDIDGSPILFGSRIYVGTLNGSVVALDAGTGAIQWTFPAGDGPVKSYIWPRIGTNDLVFSTNGTVFSINDDGASASLNWSHTTIPNPSPPVLVDPYVWVGSSDGSLYQLDISGGSPVSTSVPLGDGTATVGVPAFDGSNLFVGTESGQFYSVAVPLP